MSKGQKEAELSEDVFHPLVRSYGKTELMICDCDLRNATFKKFSDLRFADKREICLPTCAKSMTEHLKAMHGHVEEVRGLRMAAGAPVLG